MTLKPWGEHGWHRSGSHSRIQSSSEMISNWTRAYELRRAGRSLKLKRIPMELLLLLVEQRGQLVTREHIIDRIRGNIARRTGFIAGLQLLRTGPASSPVCGPTLPGSEIRSDYAPCVWELFLDIKETGAG